MDKNINTKQFNASNQLRRRAEDFLNAKPVVSQQPLPDAESSRLLHELQVHQIELDMQNMELHQAGVDLNISLEKYTDLYDFAPAGYFSLDQKGIVREVNLTGCGLFRIERARMLGRYFKQLVSTDDQKVFSLYLRSISEKRTKNTCDVNMLKEGRHPFNVQIKAIVTSDKEYRLAVIDISEQVHLREELAAKVKQLELALCQVKQLEGMIPICSYCHKIRDEKEIWNQMEKYITEHSKATFTHGICPDCFAKATEKIKSKSHINKKTGHSIVAKPVILNPD